MSLSESELIQALLENGLTTGIQETLVEMLGKVKEEDTDKYYLVLRNLLKDNWADYLYEPDSRLNQRLAEYNQWCQTKQGEDPGKLMEQIVLLSFLGLKGYDSIKSYQSYASQLDLAVTGTNPHWTLLMECLHLPRHGRTIIAEAKNISKRLSDAQFSRLCVALEQQFKTLAHLGVFFTRLGASGFSKSGQRSLRDARASQILFHLRTEKYVVVLDHDDLQKLGQRGGLPRILESKIRDVVEAPSTPVIVHSDWLETALPSHLSKYLTG